MTTPEILMAIGRLAFGGFFLIAGFRNFLNFGARVANAKTNYGWPLPPSMLAAGFAMQLVGGLSLIFSAWVVCGALLLIAFLCLATPLYHNFFLFRGEARDPHLYLTLVNIVLAAGLGMIIATNL